MTHPSEEQVERVAAGLTKAQREWVLSSDRNAPGIESRGDDEADWDAMTDLGVAEYWTDRLTPLGLAVRQFLQSKDKHSDQ